MWGPRPELRKKQAVPCHGPLILPRQLVRFCFWYSGFGALVLRYENELTNSATAGSPVRIVYRARLQPCREKRVQQQGFSPCGRAPAAKAVQFYVTGPARLKPCPDTAPNVRHFRNATLGYFCHRSATRKPVWSHRLRKKASDHATLADKSYGDGLALSLTSPRWLRREGDQRAPQGINGKSLRTLYRRNDRKGLPGA